MSVSRRGILFFAAGMACVTVARPARSCEPLAWIEAPTIVGTGSLNVLLVPILEIALFAPHGRWSEHRPFGLAVTALKSLRADKVAGHVIDEMKTVRDRALLARWEKDLSDILVDAKPADRFFVLRDRSGATRFFRGDKELGVVTDPRFTAAFFAICLGPGTSQPGLRRQLLNMP